MGPEWVQDGSGERTDAPPGMVFDPKCGLTRLQPLLEQWAADP